MKLGVLVSGSGTNLQALLDAEAAGRLAPGEIACVISNQPGVRALERAAAAGKPAIVVDHRGYPAREAFEDALLAALAEHGVVPGAGGVVLAGFMRLLTRHFVGRFSDRMINIHPSLLPSFPGAHAQRQAFDHGVKVTGCTVHLVDVEMDAGPIVAQSAVPVLPGDDVAALTARILLQEHALFPRAVQLLAAGRLVRDGRRVRVVEPRLHHLYERLHGSDAGAAEAAARELAAEAAAAGAEVMVVSACLLGEKTRYDGGDRYTPAAVDPVLADARVRVLPLCPEILGGMGCPRPAVWFVGATVRDATGRDHTAAITAGADRAGALAAAAGATRALLKERSPSCGVHTVHRAAAPGAPAALAPGRGLFADRLERRHLPIVSEADVLKHE